VQPCESRRWINIHRPPLSRRASWTFNPLSSDNPQSQSTMKAYVISEYAHHSKIPLTLDAPDPVLENDSDSLLIDVHSAGLNFFDVCGPSESMPVGYTIYNLPPDPPGPRPLPNPATTPIHSRNRVRRHSGGRTCRKPIQAR